MAKKAILKRWGDWIVIIGVGLLLCWPLFQSGYFSHHDDLQVMRIYEMRQCFADGQLPCRWVPDMGWGNGYPMFNYYSALPYYTGAILSYGLGYIGAAKALFLIVLIGGGVSMYWLLRELFGRWPGLVGTVLFMLAPYRALDSYVRGAIAESFAIMLVPMVLFATLKLVRSGGMKWVVVSALSWAGFLLCHNIMSLFFMPILLAWTVGWMIVYRRNIRLSWLAFGLGIGLAAFFVGPAYLEKSLVQTNNLTKLDLDFRAHFATWRQLFISRFWDYGASNPGPFDGISFQIGWPHWWLVGVGGVMLLSSWRKLKSEAWMVAGWLLVFGLSVLMIHNRSAVIWEQLPILWYAQFPWRWLSVTIVASGVVVAFVISRLNGRVQLVVGGLVMVLAVGLNWGYFQPKTFYPELTDQQKLSGELWEEQRRAAIMDYLPVGAIEPDHPAESLPDIRSGQAEISDFEVRSNRWRFQAEVSQSVELEVPIYDFPNWRVMVNGQDYPHYKDSYFRRVSLKLEPGRYEVVGLFQDTLIRQISNTVSVASLVVLVGLYGYAKYKKKTD